MMLVDLCDLGTNFIFSLPFFDLFYLLFSLLEEVLRPVMGSFWAQNSYKLVLKKPISKSWKVARAGETSAFVRFGAHVFAIRVLCLVIWWVCRSPEARICWFELIWNGLWWGERCPCDPRDERWELARRSLGNRRRIQSLEQWRWWVRWYAFEFELWSKAIPKPVRKRTPEQEIEKLAGCYVLESIESDRENVLQDQTLLQIPRWNLPLHHELQFRS